MEQINITSAQYYVDLDGLNSGINATIDGITMSVPLDPDNRHYAEIIRQVEAGELVVQPADTPE